jgi:NAD+ diphosphatase
LGDALTLDTTEIEDAMWVTKDEAIAALKGEADRRFNAPPPFAIAHSLLRHWVSQ